MFNNISWQGYWICLAFTTGGYYLVVCLIYFRNDLFRRFEQKPDLASDLARAGSPLSRIDNSEPAPNHSDLSDFKNPPPDSEEHMVYACMDELNAFFEAVRESKPAKAVMLSSLKVILQKYPALKGSKHHESLLNVIITQCQTTCSIHLEADDMVGVWLD
jgi:hypothetical protein